MKNLIAITLFLLIPSLSINAQDVGTQAPNFTHNTVDHGQISLSDYQDNIVYLFFFGWG